MRRQRLKARDIGPGAIGILLAVVGGVMGNVVTEQVPSGVVAEATRGAPLALGVVVLALVAISVLRGLVLGRGSSPNWRDPRQRSLLRHRAGLVLVAGYELLWLMGGLAENLTAASFPPAVKPHAWLVFGGVVLVAIALALLDYAGCIAPPVEEINRQHFLAKLHTRYSRRQEDALRGAALIVLGLKAEPDAVSQPALTVRRMIRMATGQPAFRDARNLPAGTRIEKVYDATSKRLLILGEPGAGKTTLLVELGLDLLQHARTERNLPIPVIYNLSTWAINKLALDQWLAEDLVLTYQVPRRVAQGWVARDEVLPLLDGLDEVAMPLRAACVRAINAFHQAHPWLPLAVCSRKAEYYEQEEQLAMQSAVIVQPLSDKQIRMYLGFGGKELTALRAAVEANPKLRKVLRTPLMLRIVTLTYEGLPREAIPPMGDHSAWVRQLFGEYVARMLKRRRRLEVATADSWEEVEQPEYSPEETERYLACLARQMSAHGLVEFYLEQLQPDWLPDSARWRCRTTSRLVFALVGGLVSGLIGGLVNALFFALFVPLFAGLDEAEIRITDTLQWSWRAAFGVGLLFGSTFGLIFGLIFSMPILGLVGGLAFGLVGGWVSGLGGKGVDDRDYQIPNEGIHRSMRNGLVVCLAAWLVAGSVGGLVFGLGVGLVIGLESGPLFGLFLGLVSGLRSGGGAALQHAVLRWFLRRAGLLPPQPVHFLDYAADHVLLQRVGGGYRFIHRLLQDYFANLGHLDRGARATSNDG